MDLNVLNQQINDSVNRWLQAVQDYFSDLSTNEWYGWGAFGFGFILFVVGILLL